MGRHPDSDYSSFFLKKIGTYPDSDYSSFFLKENRDGNEIIGILSWAEILPDSDYYIFSERKSGVNKTQES
ncbi:hypothetical protein DRQ07_09800 [candidate division KSB1 bacterium]|nr:MAG: hypothetical protein DRQ07_09800 [candidate division KSB1 bacterium]